MIEAYCKALAPFQSEMECLREEPMAAHTTFCIGGPAELFVLPKTAQALSICLTKARELNLPLTVIGNGSNLLVHDEGVRGIVLCTEQLSAVQVEGTRITAQAGARLSAMAQTAASASLAGAEFAAGIPGSVGGAVFMNAGAYDGQMAQIVESSTYLDERGVMHTLSNAAHAFGYRESVYKEHPDWTIVSAVMQLTQGDEATIRAKIAELAQRRRDKQPLNFPSAGSTFKRPEGHFAGKLIQDAGLQGFAIGDAQVSEKHAGFLINRGKATCTQMLQLIETVQESVQKQFGVTLECEVRLL